METIEDRLTELQAAIGFPLRKEEICLLKVMYNWGVIDGAGHVLDRLEPAMKGVGHADVQPIP